MNAVSAPEHKDLVARLREELESRYDLAGLTSEVLSSQSRRRLVAESLRHGKVRHWDFDPTPEQRYVRGDFWSALEHGQIPDTSR